MKTLGHQNVRIPLLNLINLQRCSSLGRLALDCTDLFAYYNYYRIFQEN